jgi:hypothetical protein
VTLIHVDFGGKGGSRDWSEVALKTILIIPSHILSSIGAGERSSLQDVFIW